MTTTLQPVAFRPYAPEFDAVLGDAPCLSHVADVDAHEGLVYFADENALYFTTLPKPGVDGAPSVQIKRLALDEIEHEPISVVVGETNAANGMAPDLEGGLLVCEQGTRSEHARISRLDRETGARETVVDHWRGLRLNSPNDVVAASDGSIWFTDPSYGRLQGFKPDPMVGDFVYRYDPATEQIAVVADSFDKPNGLAFSPDERTLYGFPDGLKVDGEGRIYASSFSGVQVLDPSGQLIGEIRLAGAVNFCFGGTEHNSLFITTDTAVWVAQLAAKGG